MLERIFAAANGRAALGALALLFVSSWVFDRTNPKNQIIEKLGDDYVSTDTGFFYDLKKAGTMFGRYKEMPELFAAHRKFILVSDLIYPLCYTVAAVLLLAYLYPRPSDGGERQFGWLVLLVPVLAMAFDYAENFTVLSVINTVEATGEVPRATLGRARLLTVAKISLFAVSLLLLVGFAGWRLREVLARR